MKILSAAFLIYLVGLSGGPAHASPEPNARMVLNIEEQPVRAALKELSDQTGIQVLLRVDNISVDRVVAPKLSGQWTVSEALDRLLAHTGLMYEFINQNTVRISSAPASPRAGAPDPLRPQPGESQGLRLAQAEQGRISSDASAAENQGNDQASDKQPAQLTEVVITGTNITGVDNKTVPLMIFDRDAIERSGFARTEDFIASLPQNVKSGANSPDGILAGGAGFGNVENSTAANLRGLGSNSTLTLLNGHRVAPSSYGSGVDLSMIPLSAIERIEVLTDGSSAVYGADAVGGVINIILRKDYNGAETSGRVGVLTQGGGEEKLLSQSVGRTWNGGGVLAVLQFDDLNAIHSTERAFTEDLPQPTDIYPSSKRWSGVLSAHQAFSPALEAFGDALIANNKGFSAYTSTGPFGAAQLTSGDTNTASANAGIRWQPFGDWHLEGDGLFSQVDTLSSEQFIPAAFGYTNGSPYLRNLFTIKEGDLKLDGTLWDGGASSIKAAVGGSYRREDFSSLIPYIPLDRPVSRRVRAVFAEIYAPLIGPGNALPGIRRFEVSAAVRNDSYSDFGSRTNPRFGIFWSPLEELGLRAAFSTSFRAPNPSELVTIAANNNLFVQTGYPVPTDPTENSSVIFFGNQILGPESSRNLSAGLDFTPAVLPGTRFSLNYYRIVYTNRIVMAPNTADLFINPQVYGPLLKTFASDAAVEAFVNGFEPPQNIIDQTPTGTGLAGVRYGFPYGEINAARQSTEGFDLNAHSQRTLSLRDKLFFDFNATYIRKLETGFCSTCSSTDLINTFDNPLKFRFRASGGWSNGVLSANAAVNYANGYVDTNLLPFGRIGSYTTVDANLGWRMPVLRGLTVGVNVTDLFDTGPPRTSPTFNGLTYDPVNSDPRGRAVALQVRQEW